MLKKYTCAMAWLMDNNARSGSARRFSHSAPVNNVGGWVGGGGGGGSSNANMWGNGYDALMGDYGGGAMNGWGMTPEDMAWVHQQQLRRQALDEANKPGFFGRAWRAFKGSSDDNKRTIVIVTGVVLTAAVIGIAVLIHRWRKSKMARAHEDNKRALVNESRKAGGLPASITDDMPGATVEVYILNALHQAQRHHETALKTSDPLARLQHTDMAVGIIDGLMMAIPNEDVIFQVSNGIKPSQYRQSLVMLHEDTVATIRQAAAAHQQPSTAAAPVAEKSTHHTNRHHRTNFATSTSGAGYVANPTNAAAAAAITALSKNTTTPPSK